MRHGPGPHRRRSIRLRAHDYTQSGAYFVTLCTQDRACLFGEVVDGVVRFNESGHIVADTWEWLAAQYGYVELDGWVLMPNHIHGIIVIHDGCCGGGSRRGGSRTAPTSETRKPLGRIIGAFKTVSTKRINEIRGTPGVPVWQRNYYEHIIRDGDSLNRIRRHIDENPIRWAFDRDNPQEAAGS